MPSGNGKNDAHSVRNVKKKNPVISFLSHFIYDTQKFTQLL